MYSPTPSREFDLVIFGATGFTGFFVVRELVISIENHAEYADLKWAVAGRNESKILDVLRRVGAELGGKHIDSLPLVPRIIADVSDAKSLLEMAKRTKLIINTVGPYRFFGRQVVEACVQAGTHHIDISGEPQYIETVQADFYAQALEKEILIISTCGWDSIPCDVGTHFLKKNFNGKLHSVEAFMKVISPKGYKANFGTFHSAIYGYAHANELRSIRRRLYGEVLTKKLPRSRIRLPRLKIPFTRPEFSGWNLEFPGADRSVVQRTQYYNYEHFGEHPVQIQTYFTLPSFLHVIGMILFAAIFAVFSLFSAGRSLLERYPEMFTLGMFSRNGPTREQIDSSKFSLLLFGKGWSNKENSSEDDLNVESNEPFDKTVQVKVSGCDPGYIGTSTCLVQSALTILKERSKMPKGGVLTPASAFRNTNLIEHLKSRNLTFEIISDITNSPTLPST